MRLGGFKREILDAGVGTEADRRAGPFGPARDDCSGSNAKLLQDGAHIEIVTLLPDPIAGHLDHEA
jgi:hypothetical protein